MEKIIRIIFASLFTIGLSTNFAKAQISNLSDISGTVITQKNYAEVNGSPYFFDKWVNGNVVLANGKAIKDIGLKYDQVKDELLFAGKNNEEYYFNDPIKEFTLVGEKNKVAFVFLFRNGFPDMKNLTVKSFYEVVTDGEIKLLKKNVKSISETKEYNSATTVKNINDNFNYYLANSTGITQLKKDDMKVLATALNEQKSSLILEYAKKNKLSPKKEEDLIKVITFYYSIK